MADGTWVLGIDVGTTFCVAAWRTADGRGEILEIGGQRRVPSVVYLDDDGTIVVGQAAENLAAANPARAVRAPKSRIGDPAPVVVGGRVFQTVDLLAALLHHLYDAARSQRGLAPAEVRLTYPAIWGRPRVEQLRAAAERAGIEHAMLLPEPVAAAVAYANEVAMPHEGFVAVYDLGGGTFDTAVVQAVGTGFAVVGRPVGEDRLGGELFDELLANHVGAQLEPAVWEALQLSDDAAWQQAAAALRMEARRAKEALSSHPYAEMMIALPAGVVKQRVTRQELERLMRPHIDQSVDRLTQAVADAGLKPDQLAAICVTGGASHAPLVEATIRAAFDGVPIGRRGDPKTAVALGATSPALGPAASSTSAPAAPLPSAGTPSPAAAVASGPPGDGAAAPASAVHRHRPARRWWYAAAGLTTVAAIAGGLLASRGDDTPVRTDGVEAAGATSASIARPTSTDAPPAAAAPSTSAGGVTSFDSPAEQFLGSRIARRWTLSPDRKNLSVAITVTNAAGGTFRWHHDEPIPQAVATDAAAVRSDPPAEVVRADPILRWWHELAPGQSVTFTYAVAEQASWTTAGSGPDLAAWEQRRAAATTARQAEILAAHNLTDCAGPPVPVTATVPAVGAPSNPVVTAPVTVVTTAQPPSPPPASAPPAPTVQIVGTSQICANQRSYLEGVATGAISGTWSIPSFSINNAVWSPATPSQFVEPASGAIGSTFRATLQVVNSAGAAAVASFDFTVVDCTPAPTARIDGPDVVCVGQNAIFNGVATDAVSGAWSLPEFGLFDASWTPGAPSQFVQPNANAFRGSFTWTLTVVGPTGLTAVAQKTFAVTC